MLKHHIFILIGTIILCCAPGCTGIESDPDGEPNPPAAESAADTVSPPSTTSRYIASDLRAELFAMVEKDQAVRRELIAAGADRPSQALLEKVVFIDEANTARIREIVSEHGWPEAAMVGSDGCHAAFIIVQHADMATQEEMLPLVEASFRAGDLTGECFALLKDRVLMKRGEPQLFGTQILSFDQWKDGQPAVHPIADEEHVDERRAELGMPPLAEYLEMVKSVYFPEGEDKEQR
jgi:hypothetical protein